MFVRVFLDFLFINYWWKWINCTHLQNFQKVFFFFLILGLCVTHAKNTLIINFFSCFHFIGASHAEHTLGAHLSLLKTYWFVLNTFWLKHAERVDKGAIFHPCLLWVLLLLLLLLLLFVCLFLFFVLLLLLLFIFLKIWIITHFWLPKDLRNCLCLL